MKYNNMEQFTPETIVELYKKGKPIVDIAHGLNIRGREVIAILNPCKIQLPDSFFQSGSCPLQ